MLVSVVKIVSDDEVDALEFVWWLGECEGGNVEDGGALQWN